VRILLAAATAVTILAVALLVLLTPLWTGFALDTSGSSAWLAPGQALALTNQTIVELLVGPGTFSYLTSPLIYSADEAAHLRDVRIVLLGFLALALVAGVYLVARLRRADSTDWRSVALGGAGIAVGVVVLGVVGLVAFNLAFEVFHRIFFPGGNWAFDADSWLIRLYPLTFWQLSSGALGVLALLMGAATWWFARRRAARMMAA
jgi:integral membrane protein (TIGR01906 family)